MLEPNHLFLSLFGCIPFFIMAYIGNADGRVFLLDLRRSSDGQGFAGAERACARQNARLASADELRHAVMECSFSECTHGWLYGGTVGSTVCRNVGSVLKAVDVRTENVTENTGNLDAFCVRDKGVPCGDPPSFPNTHLQEHSGFEMGDELLYTCAPGYVMPGGHSAFSLLCDSCGEWYGMVQICIRDETEAHVDYEDKFTDATNEHKDHVEQDRPEEAHGELDEEMLGATSLKKQRNQEQQEVVFSIKVGEDYQDHPGEEARGGELPVAEDKEKRRVGIVKEAEDRGHVLTDTLGHPVSVHVKHEVASPDAAMATEAPVSLLSQKHLFWFPSEAFQEEGHPNPTHPITQATTPEGENRVRASGGQSEESKEYESQEGQHQHPVDPDDHDDHDENRDDRDGNDDSRHNDDDDAYNDSRHNGHHDDQDDHDDHDNSRHTDPDDHDHGDDHVKQYIPAQRDDLDKHGGYDDPDGDDDHYDTDEHVDESARDRYGSQGEYGGRDETFDEEHDRDNHDEHDEDHPDDSEEHPDLDGDNKHGYTDHGPYDDHDDHIDRDDHDDHIDRDDHDDSREHVVFSVASGPAQNITQDREPKAATDDTWLDGYPVSPEEVERAGSTEEGAGPEEQEGGVVVGVMESPNDVEVSQPIPYTDLPGVPEWPTREPDSEQGRVEKIWPHFLPTASPSSSDSHPETHRARPTLSWEEGPSEQPFLTEGMQDHNLTGEGGERGEVEGEMGETICAGEDCPPPPPIASSHGPAVAAIILAVCAVATAAVVGAWCYRRQQQKSSMYKMNGKGQSQSRHGQQIEMQQKV